jgi:hypothetical protein
MELRNEAKNPLNINKLFILLKIWFHSKKLEKMTVQIFMHIYSKQESKENAFEIKKTLEANNEYYKSQSKHCNVDFTVESIKRIVKTSIPYEHEKMDERLSSLNLYSSNYVEGYQYLKDDYSKILNLSILLKEHDYIDNSESFYNLFKTENVNNSVKVKWKKKLSSLCFLIHCLMILKIIPESSQWAKLTSENFLSISDRKSKPIISPKTLATIKAKHKLSSLSLNGFKTSGAFHVDHEMVVIRQILLEIFEN